MCNTPGDLSLSDEHQHPDDEKLDGSTLNAVRALRAPWDDSTSDGLPAVPESVPEPEGDGPSIDVAPAPPAPEPLGFASGARIWYRLVRPFPEVREPFRRRSASLLAGLVLIGLILGLVAGVPLLWDLVGDGRWGLTILLLSGLLLAGAAYPLARSRRYELGALLAIVVLVGTSHVSAAAATDPLAVQGALAFALLGTLISAMVLPLWITAAIAASTTGAALLVAAMHPHYPAEGLPHVGHVVGAMSVMLVIAGALTRAFLRDLEVAAGDLAHANERFALAAKGANDGLWEWDLESGAVWLSARWTSLLGSPEIEGEADLDDWFGRVNPEELPRLRQALGDHVAGLSAHFEHTARMRHADGTWRWMLARGLAVRDDSGRVQRVAGSLTDVTERKQFEEQLLHDAFHDVLSGLPNRALFLNRLAHSIARAQRRSTYLFAVLFLDLDRFKLVNDSLGHRTGDTLLVHIARRLEGCVRPGDTVARLGGDEFTILLDDLEDPADADLVAHRIQDALSHPFFVDRHEIVTSVSIGIALSTHGYLHPEDLIRDADTAMYRAKAEGKARHRVFDMEMHKDAVSRLKLEADLRRAVIRNEFEVHYQPIVNLGTGVVEGFEALVRWEHPDRGLVYPDEFIPVAEETGMINAIGWTVLRQACRQTVRWTRDFASQGPLRISVNLSARQFHQAELVRGVVSVLSESGLAPEALRLEITETALMEAASQSNVVLGALREHGIRVAIDDFGTGYSSLNYLHDFEIDGLKIDRSFIGRIQPDIQPEIVQTILDLGRNLGMTVIAEGVETDLQLARLRELGCPYGQGYFFARPLDESAATRLLSHHPTW